MKVKISKIADEEEEVQKEKKEEAPRFLGMAYYKDLYAQIDKKAERAAK